MRDLFESHLESKRNKIIRLSKKGGIDLHPSKNTLKKIMVNFKVKQSNVVAGNSNKWKVSLLGQYQIFGQEDSFRK